MAISYGNVYVAQVGMGANSGQTLIAMREAEAYSGTSMILAYSSPLHTAFTCGSG